LLLGGNLEIDPRSLALTTALTSTLVLADLLAPRPAAAGRSSGEHRRFYVAGNGR